MKNLSFFYPCALIMLLMFHTTSYAGWEFSLGPLVDIEKDEEAHSIDIEMLGPVIKYRAGPEGMELGIKPLFHYSSDSGKKSKRFTLMFPFAGFRKKPDALYIHALFHLMELNVTTTKTGFKEKEFALYPFLFKKSAENKENNYLALFPIAGRLKNKFFKDEITFIMFPLFMETRKDGEVNRNFLWPILAFYGGKGQRGMRIWPLFGFREKKDQLDEKFALWPIFASKRGVFYGEEVKSLSILPFYSSVQTENKKYTTYMWPFINHIVDKNKDIERWDVPWPILNVTRGSKRQNRFFPIYSKEVGKHDKDGFILWPIYRYSEAYFADYKRRRDRVLLFIYSDIKEEPIIEGGRSGRRIDLWPLFTYSRDATGERRLHFLSIFEPFLHSNEGIEKNYSSLWRIFTWRSEPDGTKESEFLWNMFKTHKSKKGIKVSFRPIVPVFSYSNIDSEKKISFLGGLFGYSRDEQKTTVRFLFIPIKISSTKNSNGREGEGR